MGQPRPLFGLFHLKIYKLRQLQVMVKWTFPHLDLLTSSLGPSHCGRESLVGVHRSWFLQLRMPLMPTEVDTMSVFLLFASNVWGWCCDVEGERGEMKKKKEKSQHPAGVKPTSSWLWGVYSTAVLQPRPTQVLYWCEGQLATEQLRAKQGCDSLYWKQELGVRKGRAHLLRFNN